VFKVRHDCIGRVLFSLKIYNTATTILTIDYSRERERVSERERDVNEEKRGIFPGNAKRSIFAVFSPLIPYPLRKGKKKHTTNTKRKDAPGNFVRISSTTRRKRKTSKKTPQRRRRSSRRVWLSV